MLVLQRLIFLILSFHNSRIMRVIFGMFSSHGRTWEGKLVQIRKQILLMNLVCVNETFFKLNSKICITLHIVGKTKRMPEVESTWNKSWGPPSEKTNLFCNWQNLFSHLACWYAGHWNCAYEKEKKELAQPKRILEAKGINYWKKLQFIKTSAFKPPS